MVMVKITITDDSENIIKKNQPQKYFKDAKVGFVIEVEFIIQVFCDAAQCSWLFGLRHFGETYRLHLQKGRSSRLLNMKDMFCSLDHASSNYDK
jgi:hypothetical protein